MSDAAAIPEEPGPGAFEDFFRREYGPVVAVVARIVGSVAEAEAVAQDAFVKAFVRWRRLRAYDRPGAWVRRVAIRDAVRVAERSRRTTPFGEGEPSVDSPDLDGPIDLHEAIAALPPRQRAAVVLRHLAGWPTAEVAEALGCREATVRVHLHRARQAMAGALATPEAAEAEEASDG